MTQSSMKVHPSSPHLPSLPDGRKKLSTFLGKTKMTQESGVQTTHKYNQRMLETVNQIRKKEVATCTTLLGAFMQQEEITIGLGHSRQDKSHALGISAAASVGVWALFSLDYSHVQPILAKCKGNQLLVKVEDYIKALSGDPPEDSRYAAKLMFIVQGVMKTVTCNSQYISYSLERQLKEVCKMRKIDSLNSIRYPSEKWGGLFKENTLSLVEEAIQTTDCTLAEMGTDDPRPSRGACKVHSNWSDRAGELWEIKTSEYSLWNSGNFI